MVNPISGDLWNRKIVTGIVQILNSSDGEDKNANKPISLRHRSEWSRFDKIERIRLNQVQRSCFSDSFKFSLSLRTSHSSSLQDQNRISNGQSPRDSRKILDNNSLTLKNQKRKASFSAETDLLQKNECLPDESGNPKMVQDFCIRVQMCTKTKKKLFAFSKSNAYWRCMNCVTSNLYWLFLGRQRVMEVN